MPVWRDTSLFLMCQDFWGDLFVIHHAVKKVVVPPIETHGTRKVSTNVSHFGSRFFPEAPTMRLCSAFWHDVQYHRPKRDIVTNKTENNFRKLDSSPCLAQSRRFLFKSRNELQNWCQFLYFAWKQKAKLHEDEARELLTQEENVSLDARPLISTNSTLLVGVQHFTEQQSLQSTDSEIRESQGPLYWT